MSSSPNIIGPETLSKILLVTPRRIQQLANEGIMVKAARGQYDMMKSIIGYIRYLNDQIPNKQHSDGGQAIARVDAEVERAKLLKHKAELARMEEEEKKGQLVDAATQRNEAFRIARTLRNNLLNIPSRIAQDLAADTDHNQIHRKLEDEIRQSLIEVADLAETPTNPDALPLDETADCAHWHWCTPEETA